MTALDREVERTRGGRPLDPYSDFDTGWLRHRDREPRTSCLTTSERWGWDARHRAQYRVTHNGRI